VAATDDTYKQQIQGLDLTIERATERTPDSKQFHVFFNGEVRGSFRKLDQAQKLFVRLRDESGWKAPANEKRSPEEQLIFEREMHQRMAHMEYWSNSHKFRGGGKPKRK
jgi:hypothetical protein